MQTVRGYGLYANTKAEVLDRCRQKLGQGPVEKPEKLGWQDYCAGQGERHPECCPICGKRLIAGAIIAPQKKSPKSPPVPRPGAPPLADPNAATGRMNPTGVIAAAAVAQTLAGIRPNRPKPTRKPAIPQRP